MFGYGSDDESRRSPNLEAVHPRITPEDSPVPSVPQRAHQSMTSAQLTDHAGRANRSRRRRNQPSQGDAVLWQTSYPNRPDIAREAGQRVLLSGSEDEGTSANSEELVDGMDGRRGSHSISPGGPTRSSTTATLTTHFSAMNTDCMDSSRGNSGHSHHSDSVGPGVTWAKGKGRSGAPDADDLRRRNSAVSNTSNPEVDGGPPRKKLSGNDKTPIKSLKHSDSIHQSPRLLPYILSAPQAQTNAPPYFTESPAPSRSATMQAPEPQQLQLPSVKALLNEVDSLEHTQHDAVSLSRARTNSLSTSLEPPGSVIGSQATTPLAPTFPPTTSGQSPQAYAHQRGRSRTGSLPSAPNLFMTGSTAGQKRPYRHHQRKSISSTQSGSIMVPSLSSASTISPTASTPSAVAEGSAQTSPNDDELARLNSGDDAVPPGQQPAASYFCDYPGCTAAPFITQYLLKNVHSDERPYYCSVVGCARARGGKGFKRRNEMLRHGLVHDSPGFICPFCADGREHRYPRPDNLLRHVRMHHKDENIDDERLRQVLTQKRSGPGGGGRGRRRRDTGGGSSALDGESGMEDPGEATAGRDAAT